MVIAIELCQKSVISHKPYTRMVVWDCNKLVNKIIRLWYQCRRPRCLYQITIYRVINLCDIWIIFFLNSIHDCMLSLKSYVMSYILFLNLDNGCWKSIQKLLHWLVTGYSDHKYFFFIFLPAFYQSCHLFLKWLYFYYFMFFYFLPVKCHNFTKFLGFSFTFDFSCKISINTHCHHFKKFPQFSKTKSFHFVHFVTILHKAIKWVVIFPSKY